MLSDINSLTKMRGTAAHVTLLMPTRANKSSMASEGSGATIVRCGSRLRLLFTAVYATPSWLSTSRANPLIGVVYSFIDRLIHPFCSISIFCGEVRTLDKAENLMTLRLDRRARSEVGEAGDFHSARRQRFHKACSGFLSRISVAPAKKLVAAPRYATARKHIPSSNFHQRCRALGSWRPSLFLEGANEETNEETNER